MPNALGELTALDAALATAAAPTTVLEDGDGGDPSIPSAQYQKMRPRWTKCRACLVGTEAIRAGGTTYLPQYEGESSTRYHVRRVLAAFYNGFARTVHASVGMLLEEEPTLGDDMPDELVALWENVDAAGTHGAVFCRRLATAGIVDSHAGILVEHSRVTPSLLQRAKASAAAAVAFLNGSQLDGADEKALGLRPYFLLFKADDIFKPIYQSVNGKKTLVQITLRENITERKGQFGLKSVTQYRVYQNDGGRVSYELWGTPETAGSPVMVEGPIAIENQTEIPWSPFIVGDEVAPGEWKPPLNDLADKNIQYHVSLTNHLSLQALAYVPTPVRIGASPDANGVYPELVLGPGNTIEAPHTEGVAQPVYWLSPPVDVLDAGERTLTATLAAMGNLGAAFLSSETRSAETAEGKRIDSAASRATLATTSRALKDCLETAFVFMAKYLKLESGSVTLNDDFTGTGIDTQYQTVAITAYQQGALTLEELRHVLHTGQLPETFDSEETLELMAGVAAQREIDSDPLLQEFHQAGIVLDGESPKALPKVGGGPAGGVAAAEEARLNGAQITAAIEVLKSVVTGEIAKLPAIELMIAVGIPNADAERMVEAQIREGVPPAEAVTREVVPGDREVPPA